MCAVQSVKRARKKITVSTILAVNKTATPDERTSHKLNTCLLKIRTRALLNIKCQYPTNHNLPCFSMIMMLDIGVITSFITLVYHIISGFQCNK